jgi:hypothetical protein
MDRPLDELSWMSLDDTAMILPDYGDTGMPHRRENDWSAWVFPPPASSHIHTGNHSLDDSAYTKQLERTAPDFGRSPFSDIQRRRGACDIAHQRRSRSAAPPAVAHGLNRQH